MKCLSVDLTESNVEEFEVEDKIREKFIGGRGLGVYLLSKYLKDKNTDPFNEKNLLIFTAGPLSSTNIPFSGRMNLTSISPLTKTVFSSNVGSFFPEEFYHAGYDAVIVSGKSDKPCYLYISEKPEIIVEESLWGRDVFETTDFLKSKHEVKDRNIACIGTAGERLVKFANIMVQKHRAFGRGGLGAVMGSKNLKAIVVKGKRREKKDPEFIRELRKKVAETPSNLKIMGTANIIRVANENEALPTKYYERTTYEKVDDISGERLREFTVKRDSCFSCIVACKRITRSERYGITTDGPEYETIMAFGSNLLNPDLESIIFFNDFCDRYGVDTISAGASIGILIEATARGIVRYPITWGDVEGIQKALADIVKREGIGDELAEGARSFGEKYGIKAFHVKGMDIPGHDGRGIYGQGLSYAVSNRGADHLYGTIYIEEYGKPDRKEMKGKAKLVIACENRNAMLDSLVLCKFSVRFYEEKDIERILDFSLGMSYDECLRAGERTVNVERQINVIRGFSRKDDNLPPGVNIPLEEELLQYYRLRGWDEEGRPGERKLEELEIIDLFK